MFLVFYLRQINSYWWQECEYSDVVLIKSFSLFGITGGEGAVLFTLLSSTSVWLKQQVWLFVSSSAMPMRGATAVLVRHKPQWHPHDRRSSAVVPSLIAVAPPKTVKMADLRRGTAETFNMFRRASAVLPPSHRRRGATGLWSSSSAILLNCSWSKLDGHTMIICHTEAQAVTVSHASCCAWPRHLPCTPLVVECNRLQY